MENYGEAHSTSDAAAAVMRAEQALAQAHVDLDLAAIDRLLHPDYIIVQPGGRIEPKAEVLASYASGTRRWNFARSDELDVRLYAGVAIVVGRWSAKGVNGPVAFDYSARFIAVWVENDGEWRNLTSQSTEIE